MKGVAMAKKIRPVRVNHADVAIHLLQVGRNVATAVQVSFDGTIELLNAYSAWLDLRYDERLERKRFLEDAEAELKILTGGGS